MASPTRIEKINEIVKRELGIIILREFDHAPNQLITVTEVRTVEDVITARVRITIWPDADRDETFKALATQTGFFQSLLNKRLKMRPVPKIILELDTRVAEAGRIEELLEKVKNEEGSES